MSEQIDATTPRFEPKHVAKVCGVTGGQLGRLTYNTIIRASEPPPGKGSKARYSVLDICLMLIGRDILAFGVPPARVQDCVKDIRGWVLEIISDPAKQQDNAAKTRWLVVPQKGKHQILGPEAIGRRLASHRENPTFLVVFLRGALDQAIKILLREEKG